MLVADNGSCSDTSYAQVVVLYDQFTVSIEELSAGIDVQLLNGADGISVSFDLAEAAEVSVMLYNSLGQQLEAVRYDHAQHDVVPLHLSSSATGIYFVHLQAGDHSVTRKFYFGN